MGLTLGEKASLMIGSGIGVGLPPMLERLDAWLAIQKVKKGELKDPEAYPMYQRPGIVVPLGAGIPCLLAGLLGDELLAGKEEGAGIQAMLLTMGTGLTVGGLNNLATAIDGRLKAGVPIWRPDPNKQYSNKCAYRTIGAPGYTVGCATTDTIVDPPYNAPSNTPGITVSQPGATAKPKTCW
jgi:hypothetical protein